MNATLMNEIRDALDNDQALQSAIAQARAGVAPEGVVLALTGTADGQTQVLTREGHEIVCTKDGVVTRRTLMTAEIEAAMCKSFLARNHKS